MDTLAYGLGLAKGAMEYLAPSNPLAKCNPAFSKRLEPLSLIISLALASLLPLKTKPSLSNHRIIWHPSAPCGGVLSIDTQGTKRSFYNFFSIEISDHTIIFPLFSASIESAIKMHFSQDGNENPLLRTLFKAAVVGLTKLKITYESEVDGTLDKLGLCIKLIEDALEGAEIANTLNAPGIPILMNDQKKVNSPVNTPPGDIQKFGASRGDESENISLDGSDKVSELNPVQVYARNSVQSVKFLNLYPAVALTPLEIAIKNLWLEKCYLDCIISLFSQSNAIPEHLRTSCMTFSSNIAAIDSLLSQRGSMLEDLLEENNQNGLQVKTASV